MWAPSISPTPFGRLRCETWLIRPYMHNGLFPTLDDVVEFYDDVGDRDERNANLGRDQMDPLTRTLDDPDNHERELLAFLNALNDENLDRKIPDRVPSGLNPGGEI